MLRSALWCALAQVTLHSLPRPVLPTFAARDRDSETKAPIESDLRPSLEHRRRCRSWQLNRGAIASHPCRTRSGFGRHRIILGRNPGVPHRTCSISAPWGNFQAISQLGRCLGDQSGSSVFQGSLFAAHAARSDSLFSVIFEPLAETVLIRVRAPPAMVLAPAPPQGEHKIERGTRPSTRERCHEHPMRHNSAESGSGVSRYLSALLRVRRAGPLRLATAWGSHPASFDILCVCVLEGQYRWASAPHWCMSVRKCIRVDAVSIPPRRIPSAHALHGIRTAA